MVGKDLRCPECSSFAVDVDPDFNLDNCTDLQWTCETGHIVMSGFGKRMVIRQVVVAKRIVPVDPPKAESLKSGAVMEVEHALAHPPTEKRSHHAPVVHKKGKR